jgi:hypothetical protein
MSFEESGFAFMLSFLARIEYLVVELACMIRKKESLVKIKGFRERGDFRWAKTQR